MKKIKLPRSIILSFLILVLSVPILTLQGCTVRYVADYDSSIKKETLKIAKKVDLFWGDLLDTKVADREYASFKKKYNEIETDIRMLKVKNEIRAFNEISSSQVDNVLKLWIEDRKSHKESNTFNSFLAKRHRKQFIRMFTAIAKGEEEKNISSVARK